MAVVQVNTPGMASTDPGYISSITVRTGGSATVLTPNATTGQITVDALAGTRLVQDWARPKLITGG
jgi:hypothetical protein